MPDPLSWIISALKWLTECLEQLSARRRAEERASQKEQIVAFMRRASGARAYLEAKQIEEGAILEACGLTPARGHALLAELVAERRIFSSIISGFYSLSEWRPNPRRLYP